MPEPMALADTARLADNRAPAENSAPGEPTLLVASGSPEPKAPGDHGIEGTVLSLTLAVAVFVALVMAIATVIVVTFKDDMQDIKRDMKSG